MTPTQAVLRRVTVEVWRSVWTTRPHNFGQSVTLVADTVSGRLGLDYPRCARAAHILYNEVTHGHINPHESLEDL